MASSSSVESGMKHWDVGARRRAVKGETMTLREYQETPESVLPQELIYGVVTAADAPFVPHQRIVFQLARALDTHADAAGVGEVFVAPLDVILDRERALVLQPDILFVARERSFIVQDRVYGAPDLVVEVLSPNPRIGQLDDRLRWFASSGVREIWLYHQFAHVLQVLGCAGGRVATTTSFEGTTPIRSAVLPGFNRSVSGLFRHYIS
jgi:Uma2 family endonuclease